MITSTNVAPVAETPRDVEPLFIPEMADIVKVEEMTPLEKVFTLQLPGGRPLGNRPGQFVEVSVLGVGEAPISICSSPSRSTETFEMCVRKVGDVTAALHQLKAGDKVGIRGPFGRGFPIESFRGKDMLFAPGGLGLAPVRSLINQVLDERALFGRVIILYGARTPAELLFKDELQRWAERSDVELLLTVDRGDETWSGNVGVITTLFQIHLCQPAQYGGGHRRPAGDVSLCLDGAARQGHFRGQHLPFAGATHEVRRRQVRALPDQQRLCLPVGACVLLHRDQGTGGGAMSANGKPKIAFFDFTSCEGCQLTVVDSLQTHPELLGVVEIVQFREAMTEKGEDYLVAFIEGSCTRQSDEARLKEIREQAALVVALGACAHLGGVNALKSLHPLEEVRQYVYGDKADWYETYDARPIEAVIPVDFAIPGCPIDRNEFIACVKALLLGKKPPIPDYPLCVECKLKENTCLFTTGQGLPGSGHPGRLRRHLPHLRRDPCEAAAASSPIPTDTSMRDVLAKHGMTVDDITTRLTPCLPLTRCRTTEEEGERS